jgi:hypothetical protein
MAGFGTMEPQVSAATRQAGTDVSKVTGYGWDNRGSIRGRKSRHHCVQTGSGAYQVNYPMGTWG